MSYMQDYLPQKQSMIIIMVEQYVMVILLWTKHLWFKIFVINLTIFVIDLTINYNVTRSLKYSNKMYRNAYTMWLLIVTQHL